MGAAQSRPVDVRCDNTLSRLEPHAFINCMKPFCERIEIICNDYFKRSLDAIVYHALCAYIQKHSHLDKNVMMELVKDVTIKLEGFIAHVRELRDVIGHMKMTVNHTAPASFLNKLSANPICIHILSQMGCRTMMVGGAITTFKEVVRQECWRNAKLTDFFARLGVYLIETFKGFEVVSTSQIELEVQFLDQRMQILDDPDFGKEELSKAAMAIKSVLLDIRLEKLKSGDKTTNVRGA
jgi:hypothetical protein